jgi:Zn-dependent protease
MLLSEPPQSPYDLQFKLGGIPVRIAWSFWLVAVVLGYDNARFIDALFAQTSNGIVPWLAIWCGVMFVSILLHEMGHAVAFRLCGFDASVVLYHFGGLAIPASGFGRTRATSLSAWQNIAIAAAGPGVQLLLAAIVLAVVHFAGYEPTLGFPSFLGRWDWLHEGDLITEPGLYASVMFLLHVNIYWALFNLIPVWPLDGGRIMREAIELCGGSTLLALQVSMIVAGAVALWFFKINQPFAAILFASMAASNYQLISGYGGWRV